MSSLSSNLVSAARKHPDRVALRCDALNLTYAEFDAAAARVATLLERAGVAPGDRVGVMLPNIPALYPSVRGRLLRHHVSRRRSGADESAAQGS